MLAQLHAISIDHRQGLSGDLKIGKSNRINRRRLEETPEGLQAGDHAEARKMICPWQALPASGERLSRYKQALQQTIR